MSFFSDIFKRELVMLAVRRGIQYYFPGRNEPNIIRCSNNEWLNSLDKNDFNVCNT